MMNTHTQEMKQIVSVYDLNSDRQAKNLSMDSLTEAVAPWFQDWEDAEVRKALSLLQVPSQRSAAAEYLGLDVRLAA